MVKIISKIFSCAVIILLWFNISNLTILLHLSAKNYILLGALLVSAVLPCVLRKNIVVPLCITLAISVGMCIYESAYLVWAVPMLCTLYAYIISRDESKSLRHKTRLHIAELLIVGVVAMAIPIAIKIKTFIFPTYYDFKTVIPVVLVLALFAASAFHTAFFRKAQHKDKQTAKLLFAAYLVAVLCFLAESVFYMLVPYFSYCEYKFILLPWIVFICFIVATDDPNVKFITEKIDLAFDKFSKIDVEKK